MIRSISSAHARRKKERQSEWLGGEPKEKEGLIMAEYMSCCGTVCSDCEYYPDSCGGCEEIEGKVFWLEYTGEEICSIYDCCMNGKRYAHCGQCEELPCRRYDGEDPTKSAEENRADHLRQVEALRRRYNRSAGITERDAGRNGRWKS